jgi:PleD family two-component response regulator
VAEVGILVIDDDIATQRSLKLVLDSEGWRVRIVAHPSHALAELAANTWDLAIVNTALLDMQGPVFLTLKELAQSDASRLDSAASQGGQAARKHFRTLFLVPLMGSKDVPLILEREGLPYSFKPYHLHDFLQKVSELLLESGAISEPIRSVEGFASKKRSRDLGSSRDSHGGKKMFASREDYQMTEEELAEFERQEKEEDERKKRARQILNREPL